MPEWVIALIGFAVGYVVAHIVLIVQMRSSKGKKWDTLPGWRER